MPALRPPDAAVRRSFLTAMDEFRAEGRGQASDDTMLGREIRQFGGDWPDPDRFQAYVSYLRGQAAEDAPRPAGHVPSTTLWWADGAEYLGRLAVRHRLNQRLLDRAGTSATTCGRPPGGRGTPPPCWPRHCRWPARWASARPWSPVIRATPARAG